MPTTLKMSGKKSLCYREGFFGRDEPGWQRKHVSVVVLARKRCYLSIPSKCRANALVLIRSNVHTVTASADKNTKVRFATDYALCNNVRVIRIINTFQRPGTRILHSNTPLREMPFQFLFEFETRVVPSYKYAQRHAQRYRVFISLL